MGIDSFHEDMSRTIERALRVLFQTAQRLRCPTRHIVRAEVVTLTSDPEYNKVIGANDLIEEQYTNLGPLELVMTCYTRRSPSKVQCRRHSPFILFHSIEEPAQRALHERLAIRY